MTRTKQPNELVEKSTALLLDFSIKFIINPAEWFISTLKKTFVLSPALFAVHKIGPTLTKSAPLSNVLSPTSKIPSLSPTEKLKIPKLYTP